MPERDGRDQRHPDHADSRASRRLAWSLDRLATVDASSRDTRATGLSAGNDGVASAASSARVSAAVGRASGFGSTSRITIGCSAGGTCTNAARGDRFCASNSTRLSLCHGGGPGRELAEHHAERVEVARPVDIAPPVAASGAM